MRLMIPGEFNFGLVIGILFSLVIWGGIYRLFLWMMCIFQS